VKEFRALYAKVIVDKHEDVMSKFGAILAQGIIDAGELSNNALSGLNALALKSLFSKNQKHAQMACLLSRILGL
jgi:hypothetical protein